MRRKVFLTEGSKEHEVILEGDGARLVAWVDGRRYDLENLAVHRDGTSLLLGHHSYWAHLAPEGTAMHVKVRGHRFGFETFSERDWHFRSLGGGAARKGEQTVLSAPMPGKVVRILVAPGDAVEPGTPLVVLEAMKMENELKASGSARVSEVLVAPHQAVEKGAVLVRFAPLEAVS